jgi:hypothetical protein
VSAAGWPTSVQPMMGGLKVSRCFATHDLLALSLRQHELLLMISCLKACKKRHCVSSWMAYRCAAHDGGGGQGESLRLCWVFIAYMFFHTKINSAGGRGFGHFAPTHGVNPV